MQWVRSEMVRLCWTVVMDSDSAVRYWCECDEMDKCVVSL